MEKDVTDIIIEDLLPKSHAMIRCAKSAMFLLSLKSPPNRYLEMETLRNVEEEQEKESLRTSIEELKMELVIERIKRRQMEVRRTVDLAIEITLLISLWIIGLMLVSSIY